MDKLIVGVLVIWGLIWLLGALLRSVGHVYSQIRLFLERTQPARNGIRQALGYQLGRFIATIINHRSIDRFLIVFVVALIAAANVNGSWLVEALDGFAGTNFPLLGWAFFGCVVGVAIGAGSRILELGWIGSASSIARVPDMEHLRSGEVAANRSFRTRLIVGAISILFLLAALAAGYWRSGGYHLQAGLNSKTAEIAAAGASGNVVILNSALEDAVARLNDDPKSGLNLLLALQSLSKDGSRPEVGRVSAAAQQYLKAYLDDTEKAVTEGSTDALVRSEAFGVVDKSASLHLLGRLHEAGGKAVPRDLAKAFSYYKEAADGGDKKSLAILDRLARMMQSQKDNATRQTALRYWEPKAESGDLKAFYMLGEWYGKSTELAEIKKAEMWLHKALAQDKDVAVKGMAFSSLVKMKDLSKQSMLLLDDLAPKYVKGMDQKLKNAAYAYLEQRANLGDPGSVLWMGFRFNKGDGVPKDGQKAREWFLKAALQNENLEIKDLAITALGEMRRPPKSGVNGFPSEAEKATQGATSTEPEHSSKEAVLPPPNIRQILPSQPPSSAPKPSKTVSIPENAQLNIYGNGWVCSNGFRQVGNECARVIPPANAGLNVYGNGWVCNSGFRQAGNECAQVIPPPNAGLNVYGNGWVCKNGFRQVGNECARVIPPANAGLNVYGNGWVCNSGFRQVGNECARVIPPANAGLNVYGNGWVCNSGFRQAGNECAQVIPPSNAGLNVYGNGWVCNNGFRQVGNECVPILSAGK